MAALDPLAVAMTQQAHTVLNQTNQVAAPAAGIPSVPAPTTGQMTPSSFLGNRVDQMAGIGAWGTPMAQVQRTGPSALAAAQSYKQQRAADAVAAQQAAELAQRQAYGGDMFSQSDFERGNLEFAGQLGLTGEDALAAAAANAPSYGGAQFTPHNIAQEGHVEYRNGVPGIYIKYSAPGQGSSTEWTPLG